MNGRWIALLVVMLLVAGLGLAVAQWDAQRARPSAPPAPPAPDTALATDQAITEALASAPVDSAALKLAWHDEVRGIDASDLNPAQRELYLRYANSEQCTCGCGYTLAGCLASDMVCDISRPRTLALLDSVRTGKITSARGLRQRPEPH